MSRKARSKVAMSVPFQREVDHENHDSINTSRSSTASLRNLFPTEGAKVALPLLPWASGSHRKPTLWPASHNSRCETKRRTTSPGTPSVELATGNNSPNKAGCLYRAVFLLSIVANVRSETRIAGKLHAPNAIGDEFAGTCTTTSRVMLSCQGAERAHSIFILSVCRHKRGWVLVKHFGLACCWWVH